MNPVNLFEFEKLASEKVEKTAWDYISAGAEDGVTLRENREAWERIILRPRVLKDVSKIDLTTSLYGTEMSMPILLAPTAMQMLVHDEGELATARAAGSSNVVYTLSTIASKSIEEVADASSGPLWFQLYFNTDRNVTKDLLKRVKASGYQAVCLTVDTPKLGRREPDIRNNFMPPPHVKIVNFEPYVNLENMPADVQGSALAAYATTTMDPAMNWDDIAWLREAADLPFLLKGIVTAEDAKLAVEAGVDGIIVSNHGGRQLDGAPATIEALPEVVEAVDGKLDVLVDGGVRRGTDVVKAIALGAKAVLIGRPYVWGLAVNGENGVKRVISMLREELELTMALVGCRSIDEIRPDHVSMPW